MNNEAAMFLISGGFDLKGVGERAKKVLVFIVFL